MTYAQYKRKREAIAISEAPIEVRVQAIEALDSKFTKQGTAEATRQIEESAPEPIKLGDD